MSQPLAQPSPISPLMTGSSNPSSGCWRTLVNWPLHVLGRVQGSLQAKFIVVMVSLVISVMAAVFVLMERHQRAAILEQTQLRALSVGRSLAALGEGYLLSYDFTKLEQAAERLTAEDEDVIYTVAHLRDGRVAAFSGRSDLQGKMLDDSISHLALQATEPLLQAIIIPQTKEPGYDVAIPVFSPQSSQKWGTIRLGFSLQRAYEEIHQTRRAFMLLSVAAVVCSTLLASVLALRISKPISQLVVGVHAFAGGAYDHPVHVEARDEIGYLARAFEQMRQALQLQLAGLAVEKQFIQDANRRLKETQRQLLHLAARVAHEVNNPLAIIKTAIRNIKDESREDDASLLSLQIIEEEINRIARIIREILMFSRPGNPDEWVELSEVVQSLEGLLRPGLLPKQIELKLILEPELPRVRISSDHLKQVILNMVRNAEDAMPEGGVLVMQTARTPEGVALTMTDTGCGIPEAYISRLFDPFFTTKDKAAERGTGLGLAVSSGIIREVDGRIEVTSEVGKGSTFRVCLPAGEG